MKIVTIDQMVVGETYYLELPRFRGEYWESDTYRFKSTILSIETKEGGEMAIIFGKNCTINGKSDMIGTHIENKNRSILNRRFEFVYNPLSKQLYSVETQRTIQKYVAAPYIAERFLQQYTSVYTPMKEVAIRQKENRLINNILQYITGDPYFIWA